MRNTTVQTRLSPEAQARFAAHDRETGGPPHRPPRGVQAPSAPDDEVDFGQLSAAPPSGA